MKKGYKLLGMILALVLACGCFAGCGGKNSQLSYVDLRVNPEIELVVDGNGKVVAANAVNDDGETLLCKVKLVGKKVEVAAELFTEAAIELGFISVTTTDTAVYVLTCGVDEEQLREIEAKVTQKINDVFDEIGVFGQAIMESKAEYEALAAEWGVSVEQAVVIQRVLELYPEKTVDEIKALTLQEQLKLIRDDSKIHGLVSQLRDEYTAAVDEIKAKYGELFALGEELIALEVRLADEELSEEERATLQAEYDAKKARFDELKAQYEAEIEQANQTVKQDLDAVKAQIEASAQSLKAEFEDRIRLHKEAFSKLKDQILEQIRKWREGRG